MMVMLLLMMMVMVRLTVIMLSEATVVVRGAVEGVLTGEAGAAASEGSPAN